MERKQFQAESKRLLDLMIHSIYTHQEIFLREIISNGSDAMDKLAYTALTDDKVSVDREKLAITITRDPQNRTLTVSPRMWTSSASSAWASMQPLWWRIRSR